MDKKEIKKTIKKVQFLEDPETAKHDELLETNEHLEAIHEKLESPLKVELGGEQGEKVNNVADFVTGFLKSIKGEKGDKPVKGVDYFDGKDGKDGKTPVKGVDYFDGKDAYNGKDGKDGKDGRDGRDGKDGKTPIKGVDYRDGKDGKDGKDGTKIEPKEVIDYLKTLKGSDRLPLSAISEGEFLMKLGSGKKMPVKMEELMHGAGLSKVATDNTLSGDGTPDNPLSASPAVGVLSVTGLNTDNTDPINPVVKISVDGLTITGDGTPSSPLVASRGGIGDVTGPVGAIADSISLFDGTTGKIIKDSNVKISELVPAVRTVNSKPLSSDIVLTPSDIGAQPTGSYEVNTNKENVTIDTSTTKYPTVNLLKTGLDTKLNLNQTVPQTIINGRPTFAEGIKLGITPTVGAFEEGKIYYDVNNKTVSAMIDTDIIMQIGQEELVLVYNNTGSAIANGMCVYSTGANGDMPTIALAKADALITSKVLGMTTQAIANGASGFVNVRGIVHDVDTSTFIAGQELYLSATTAGEHTATTPTDPTQFVIRIGRALIIDAVNGSIYVRQLFNNRLSDLDDVTISTPVVDQVLKYNGSEWINGEAVSINAGNGVSFFLDDTAIIPAGAGPQTIPVHTLSKSPITATPEVIDSATVNNNTLLIERYLYNTALGGNQIDAGVWTFNNYCLVNNTGGVTTLPVTIRKVMLGAGTLTITGTGTSRTATVTGGTPFLAGDATADITLGGLLQTPNGCFKITGFTSTSVVTVETLSTYTNENGVTYLTHRFLFTDSNTEINNLSVGLVISQSAQPAFAIDPTDKLSASYFARTTATANRIVSLYHNGTEHYSNFVTPLVIRHNDLSGLQGGTAGQYNHLTNAQLTVVQNTSGTNTGDQSLLSLGGAPLRPTTEKITLVDADEVTGNNSANSFSQIRTTWTNVKSFLKTYFDGLYATTTQGTLATNALPKGGGTMTGPIVQGSYTNLSIPSSDHTATGIATNAILSGATISAFQLVYLGTGGKWLLTDSDAIATSGGMLGIALEAKNDTQAMLVALAGSFVRDDTWNWTIGQTLYAGETAGAIQATIPTGADGVVRVIGFAISADVIYFNPSSDNSTVVA